MDAKAQSALDLKKSNLKDETKKRKELVKNMEEVMDWKILLFYDLQTRVICTSESFIQTVVFLHLQDKKMLVVKEKEVSVLTKQLQALQEEGKNDSAALEAAEQHFKAVSAGLSTNEDGEEATLAGQMMACKNDISKADTEAKQVTKSRWVDVVRFRVLL